MDLTLIRYYSPTEVTGYLCVGEDWSCSTIERPWRRGKHPGGEPFLSCIPEGKYDMFPYQRHNGDRAFALINNALGVFLTRVDRPRDPNGAGIGRFKCLIHGRANYVEEVQGCVAVGKERRISKTRHEVMVTNSTATMLDLLDVVPWTPGHTLEIVKYPGAIDIPPDNWSANHARDNQSYGRPDFWLAGPGRAGGGRRAGDQ